MGGHGAWGCGATGALPMTGREGPGWGPTTQLPGGRWCGEGTVRPPSVEATIPFSPPPCQHLCSMAQRTPALPQPPHSRTTSGGATRTRTVPHPRCAVTNGAAGSAMHTDEVRGKGAAPELRQLCSPWSPWLCLQAVPGAKGTGTPAKQKGRAAGTHPGWDPWGPAPQPTRGPQCRAALCCGWDPSACAGQTLPQPRCCLRCRTTTGKELPRGWGLPTPGDVLPALVQAGVPCQGSR